MRASRFDYDRWEKELGCQGWSWEALLPFFKSIETFEDSNRNDKVRGSSGELRVRRPDDLTPVAHGFIKVCNDLGLPSLADYNDGMHQQGVTTVQFNARNNERQSAYRAFVKPILEQRSQRANLTLRLGSPVIRVLFDDEKCATGVHVGGDRPAIIKAARDIILTAGAYETAKLLLISGIGDSHHLAELNVPLVADVPGVGLNLSDHLWVLIRQMVANAEHKPNPKTEDWMQMQAFGALDGTIDVHRPDFQLLLMCNEPTLAGLRLPPEVLATSQRNWALAVASLHPTSRGSVRLRSADPSDPPLIDPNFLATEEDRIVWRKIAAFCARVADAMSELFPSTRAIPAPGCDDDMAHVRAAASTMWHPVGTAKMGPASDMFSVTHPVTLAVRGVRHLRVADASIIPAPVSGNTNVPVMAVAARAASLIAACHATTKDKPEPVA